MKKMFKVTGIIFIILIVLIVIAMILFKIFITPEKVRALVVTQMEKTLNREVEIQDLSISIFKGMSVEGFKISESPTFKEGTFISSKRFIVRYKLLPLLRKQLSISTVVLEEPYLNIIRESGGNFNFSDLILLPPKDQEKEPLTAEEKQASKVPAFGLLVSRAKLKDGEVNFVDYSADGMSLKIHNVNLDISGISPVSPMDIKFSAGLEHKEISGNLFFTGKLDLDKGILEIEELSPSYNDIALTIKGSVEDLKEKPKLDITLQDKKINIEDISRIFTLPEGIELRGRPSFKIDISGPTDNFIIRTDADMEKISVKYQDIFEKKEGSKCVIKFQGKVRDYEILELKQSLIYLEDLNILASRNIKKLKALPPTLDITIQTKESDLKALGKFLPVIKGINLSGKFAAMADIKGVPPEKLIFASELNLDDANFQFDDHEVKSLKAEKILISNNELDIPEMKGIWNEAEFQLSCKAREFSLQKFTSPNLSFALRLSRLNLERILLPLPPSGEKTKENPEMERPSKQSPLVNEIVRGIKVDGSLKIDRIIYQDFKLSKADAKINMRQGRLDVKPLSVEGYEGTLSGELQADLKQVNDIRFATNINLKNLNCNSAIMDLHPQKMARIHGKAFLDSILSGESSRIPASLEGSGYLKIENGKIESDMPLLEQFMILLGNPQPDAVIFSELKGHYKLKDNRIITEDLQMIGDEVSIDAQGWADFDKNLHFDVTARVDEKLIGKDVRKHIVRDKQGRSLLFIIVQGDMNKPDIHPDLQKTLAEQAKQKVKDSVLDKVLDKKDGELRKGIEKGLNQLFKFKK